MISPKNSMKYSECTDKKRSPNEGTETCDNSAFIYRRDHGDKKRSPNEGTETMNKIKVMQVSC